MNEKILIIDAHPVYIHKLNGFIRGLTYQNISLAKSAGEGIEVARLEQPALIILSEMLPDMDCEQVIGHLKETLKDVKIIVQIGLFTEDAVIKKLEGRGTDHIILRKEKDLLPLQEAIVASLPPSGSLKG